MINRFLELLENKVFFIVSGVLMAVIVTVLMYLLWYTAVALGLL